MRYRIKVVNGKYHVRRQRFIRWERLDVFTTLEEAQECVDLYEQMERLNAKNNYFEPGETKVAE